jgi:hypothetical protein
VKPEVWEWWGYDLIALASHKLKQNEDAFFYGETAFFANSGNQRLRRNLDFYRAAKRSSDPLRKKLSISEKLQGLPPIRVISLPGADERKAKLSEKLSELPELEVKYIEAIRAKNTNYQDVQNAILASHLRALEDFLENSTEDWTLVAEDDVNFELVKYWPFTWKEKFNHLRSHEIEIAQLQVVTMKVAILDTELHPRKSGFDWGAAAYLVSRKGALQILNKTKSVDSPVEENLFARLNVFSEALFMCDTDNEDAFHAHHTEPVFKPGFEKAITDMKARIEMHH